MTPEQFGEAYSRNFEPMVRAFTQRDGRRDKAEEIVQSAWVRGFERLDQLRDDRALLPWIRQIAGNKRWDDIRSRQRVRQLEPEDVIAVEPNVNLVAIDAERDADRILQLCDDERQRTMCLCVYIHESPTAVVAQDMGISSQALMSRLARTRRVLRKKARSVTLTKAVSDVGVQRVF